ncbi:SCAN domain-containing protein 3 [Trichonephila clavipes]|nr:SCAN domain-containing protein 3 [Trichonephila clavipes]
MSSTSKKRVNFNRQHHESYLKYGFIGTGEAAVEKIAHVPLLADSVTKRIEEIAEDFEAQLFKRINASPWYALQVDESTDIDKTILLAYVRYLY